MQNKKQIISTASNLQQDKRERSRSLSKERNSRFKQQKIEKYFQKLNKKDSNKKIKKELTPEIQNILKFIRDMILRDRQKVQNQADQQINWTEKNVRQQQVVQQNEPKQPPNVPIIIQENQLIVPPEPNNNNNDDDDGNTNITRNQNRSIYTTIELVSIFNKLSSSKEITLSKKNLAKTNLMLEYFRNSNYTSINYYTTLMKLALSSDNAITWMGQHLGDQIGQLNGYLKENDFYEDKYDHTCMIFAEYFTKQLNKVVKRFRMNERCDYILKKILEDIERQQ